LPRIWARNHLKLNEPLDSSRSQFEVVGISLRLLRTKPFHGLFVFPLPVFRVFFRPDGRLATLVSSGGCRIGLVLMAAASSVPASALV